jgi:hypothetical protein
VLKVTLLLLLWLVFLGLRSVHSNLWITKLVIVDGIKTFYGTPETVRVHWMGLNSLVAARGGLKHLSNEMVRKLVVA